MLGQILVRGARLLTPSAVRIYVVVIGRQPLSLEFPHDRCADGSGTPEPEICCQPLCVLSLRHDHDGVAAEKIVDVLRGVQPLTLHTGLNVAEGEADLLGPEQEHQVSVSVVGDLVHLIRILIVTAAVVLEDTARLAPDGLALPEAHAERVDENWIKWQ